MSIELLERRRELINQAQANVDYIKDGLVLHLDGVDATTSSWVDRVDGNTINLYNVTKNSDDDGVIFNGSSSYGYCSKNFGSGASGTIEIVANTNSYSGSIFIVAQKNPYISFVAASSGDLFCQMGATTNLTRGTITGKHTVCLTRNKGFKDLSKLSQLRTYSLGDPDSGLIIGRRSLSFNQMFSGTLFQLRIYDRVLTDAEILFNQKIDISRYNI